LKVARIACIHHFTKGTEGRSPIDRISGSLAFGALARVVMVAAKIKGEPRKRVLARAKSNIGRDDGGFYYRIEPTILPSPYDLESTHVFWESTCEGDAHAILNEAENMEGEEKSASRAVAQCMDFLSDILRDGPKLTKNIQKEAKQAGLCWNTIRKAKDLLGIIAGKDPSDSRPWNEKPWRWELPLNDERTRAGT
jgi:putative DNA primase/helicase